ncbi:MAG: FAD-dependent oxidoreductase [Planctomycetota bacterium]|jgi:oxygen-dependent protoporphyrinogen oxidase
MEGFRPLGVLFVHDIFPVHVPDGFVVLRVMMGGATDPAVLELDDAQLVSAALDPLKALLGLKGAPERMWLGRVGEAAPQYVLGHAGRVAEFEKALARHPGLHLAGDSFHGIGINPAFKRSRDVVDAIAAEDAPARQESRPAAVGA